MPSSRVAKKAILLAIPPNPKVIYEWGSGWGGVAFLIAKAFPSAQVYAVELSWIPWLISRCAQKLHKCPNLTIQRKNFYHLTCAEADVVVCYLYSGAMRRLKSKFEKELTSGAVIISNAFVIPGWEPQSIIALQDIWRSSIFVYKKM